MNAQEYQKVKEIFQSVLEIAPEDRLAFLDQHCDGDDSLRAEVERLLESSDTEFLNVPAGVALTYGHSTPASRSGQQIGHYNILEKIGSGGMGDVYLAEDGKLRRRVAIKFLSETLTSDPDRLHRFEQEAQTASGLNHPNILTIYEVGETENAHYIVTEYIDGETLRTKLNRDRLSLTEALDIAVQCASALSIAHENGIIHRDIKPENIMLRRDNLVKVLDFGLAKLVEKPKGSVSHDALTEKHLKTAPGVIMGTVQYMSPEQTRGHATDARTDIWSLGVVIYEMVGGTPPFVGENSADLIAEIVKTHPVPVSRSTPYVPEGLDDIIAKTLKKNADERYPTSNDLLTDLKQIKRKLDFETEVEPSQLHRTRRGDAAIDTAHNATTIITAEDRSDTSDVAGTVSSAEYVVSVMTRHKWKTLVVTLFGMALLAATGFGIYSLIQPQTNKVAESSRVTTTGKARTSAISNDGKYIAYSLEELGKWSLWIKNVATQQSVQIISPSDELFGKLSFSPDTNYIYYTRSTPGVSVYGIHVVPLMGGTQRKIAEAASPDWFDFSRTGDQVAFVRYVDGHPELVVANANGGGEKIVLKRGSIASPSWLRNDEAIAFVSTEYGNGTPTSAIVEVNLDDLREKTIPHGSLTEVSDLTWIPDGSGFLMIAKDGEMSDRQIWNIGYPAGTIRRVTSDFGDYNGLSLTGDSTKVVSVRSVSSRGIWVAENGDFERAKQITFGSGVDGQMGVSWTPNGQIVYTSYSGNKQDIWIMDANGSNQEQLTLNSGNNVEPSVCADNRYIVFVSDRSGPLNIWRMDIDGNNPIQLTTDIPGRFPQCSPDGNLVIYQSFWDKGSEDEPTLWKVPIAGGSSERVTESLSEQPAISPNGKLIALVTDDGIVTMPQTGGIPRRLLKIRRTYGVSLHRRQFYRMEPYFRWLADNSGVVYVKREEGQWARQGLWKIGLTDTTPQKLADFDGDAHYWDWSRDGLRMAYGKSSGTASDVVMVSDW